MSIERFYTTSIAVSRMEWENDSSGQVSQGSFSGHIQQARPDFVVSIKEDPGTVFLVWCRIDTDVEAGDTLTIASGDYAGTYKVQNVTTNSTGRNPHLELVAIKTVA